MTDRDAEDEELLRRVRKVEFGLRNELLSAFRLIDTPGLGSVYVKDAANAMDVLGIGGFVSATERAEMEAALAVMSRSAGDVVADSAAELERADAVLYLFSRALHERDRATVEDFLGPAAASVTPLKAFGVLSRCDQYWPPSEELPGAPDPLTYDPLAVGRMLAREYHERPQTRRLFFTVVPIAGLVAVAARTMTGQELDWLSELSRVPPGRLASRLADAGLFAGKPELPEIALDRDARRALVNRLGVWGIHMAAGYLRDGLTEDELRARLVVDSGVAGLREVVVGHFGNRSSLIKLEHGLADIDAAVARHRTDALRESGQVANAAGDIASIVERIRTHEPGFAAMRVLAAHYRGELSFAPAEVAELLRVTGEHGVTIAARLDLPEGSSPAELERAAEAGAAAWAVREQDPLLDRATAGACRVLRRAYERLANRAREARLLLETDADPTVEKW